MKKQLIAVRSHTPATAGECYWLASQAPVRFRAELSQLTEEGDYLILGTPLVSSNDARRHPRVAKTLTVLSRDLPNYQAVTLDIGPGGLRLKTRLPLDPGEELPLSLDLPPSDLLFHCRLHVLWSKPLEDGYASGCRFVFAPAGLARAIQRLLRPIVPVSAWLESYHLEDGQAEIALHFPGRGTHQVRLSRVVAVTDRLRESPSQVDYLSHTRGPDRERFCLLSPSSEELLCIDLQSSAVEVQAQCRSTAP